MKRICLLLCIITIYCCSSPSKNSTGNAETEKGDTLEIIRGYILGLWSMDTGNVLNNEGFNFKPDGSVDFVASESGGFWELNSRDSLKIIFSSYNEETSSVFKIDSISDGRMILTANDGRHLFRKVPFGINNEGVVQQGFSGSIEAKQKKEYPFKVQSARKIQLRLSSPDTNVVINVFDGNMLLTPVPVKGWTAIMIRSGEYKVQILNNGKSTEPADFDVKVIVY